MTYPTNRPPTRRNGITMSVMRWFRYDHLGAGLIQDTSKRFAQLADGLTYQLDDSPELTKALNALLEAKDWAVRAAVAQTTTANPKGDRDE